MDMNEKTPTHTEGIRPLQNILSDNFKLVNFFAVDNYVEDIGLKEIWTDDKVKKEFTTMMVCFLRFQADTPEDVILAFMLYLLITTLVRCLYYYKVGEPEFVLLLQGFMQNMTFFGALLLYLRMKIKIGRWQSKKKVLKFKKT